jgi:uncharacterized protein
MVKAAPAFDCNHAEGEVETLICSDPALQELDRTLAKTYARAMQTLTEEDKATEKNMQRGWIKGRNDCWQAEDIQACITYSYQSRIVELQIRSGALEAPEYAALSCEQEPNAPFTANFYNSTEPRSVVLTRNNDQVIAFATPSASGARYQAESVDFWTKGKEASIEWYGISLTCTLP